MLRAIIFDMDGVLIDSPKYNWKSFNQLLAKYGVAIGKEEIKNRYLGRSLRDQIKMIREAHHIEEEIDIVDFSRKANVIQLRMMRSKVGPNKQVQRLMHEAKANDIKIAVATSSTKARAAKILKLIGVFDLLNVLITADDIEKHKPYPDIYLKAADALEANPKDCIVFEDALDGIISARKAGMKVIGIVTVYHTRKELHEADLVIDKFSQIDIATLEKLTENRHRRIRNSI